MMNFGRIFRKNPPLQGRVASSADIQDALWNDILIAEQDLCSRIQKWIAVSGEDFVPWAPHLNPERLVNCRVLTSRYHLLDLLPKNSVCVEVGTQEGRFARHIIDKTKPKALHLIDFDLRQLDASKLQTEISSGQIILHGGDSSAILSEFPDKFFDWIYIDGDHGYPGVKKDLAQAKIKIKDDGLIACNDYTHWSPAEVHPYGVPRAVNELCIEDDWELVYIALQGQGYHDVCIRRRIHEPR